MRKDRVVAIRETTIYEPRYRRHVVSAIRITGYTTEAIIVEENCAVFATTLDAVTQGFNVGRYVDRLVRVDGQ